MSDFKIALGIDYGRRKMGAAIGQHKIGSTHPLPVINVKNREPDWTAIDNIVKQWNPEFIIFGLPTNLDGTTHELAKEIRKLGKVFEKRYCTQTFFVDEHLSSKMAAERKKTGLNHPLDSIAAGLILETWFGEQK